MSEQDPTYEMRLLEVDPDAPIDLPPFVPPKELLEGKAPRKVRHIFAREDIDVVNAALVTRRPVLLRGEPGIGKSQLARAVAHQSGRAFVSTVVDARTEPRDLLYRYDAVRRLGAAQVQGKLPHPSLEALDEAKFVEPGPLWWAFSWKTALDQIQEVFRSRGSKEEAPTPWCPLGFNPETDGVVVLIDEIDKADPSVPNGLLEALGQRSFLPMGRTEPIRQTGPAPLVVITSNEERTLPGAFLRRCWVREIRPEGDLAAWLTARGRAHFPDLDEAVVDEAVRQLMVDRGMLEGENLTPPGQAELIDLLAALDELGPVTQEKGEGLPEAQLRLLKRLAPFALKKHPQAQSAAVSSSRSEAQDEEPSRSS